MHVARSEHYKKSAKWVYYKLRNDFINLNPGIKTTGSIHVVDSTIKPILLHYTDESVQAIYLLKDS